MLFRRISAHLKRQDWFAVWLDLLNVVSWISGWSKFHATILTNHLEESMRFRDLLLERLEQ